MPKADENGPIDYVVVFEREAGQTTANQSIQSGPSELRAGDVSEFSIEDLKNNVRYRIYVFAQRVQLVDNVYNKAWRRRTLWTRLIRVPPVPRENGLQIPVQWM